MKTFSQLKDYVTEGKSKVQALLGKSSEELEKLKYTAFPSVTDPELRSLSYVERSTILQARDKVFAKSATQIKKDLEKFSRAAFKKSGAKVGDFTTLGKVTRVKRTAVVFNGDKLIPFSATLIGGVSMFHNIRKITETEYNKSVTSKTQAYAAAMTAYAATSPRRLD
jgi:hypothetical protein